MAKIYILAVEGINRGFVAMACKRFIQGQVPRQNFTWRPTPAELAVEARRLQGLAVERDRIARLPLAPKPKALPGPQSDEDVVSPEKWQALQAELKAAGHDEPLPNEGRYRTVAPVPDYTPKADISDLPDRNASWAEVKAWEERQKNREGQHADGS